VRQLAERNPGASLSYEWHAGSEITLAVNVMAPNAATAMVVGAALLLTVIPHPPKTMVTSFDARPSEGRA
jgi:hypothetical protein